MSQFFWVIDQAWDILVDVTVSGSSLTRQLMGVSRWRLFKCLYSGDSPARVMCPAVCDPDCLGFQEFYKLLVDKAGYPIAEILRVFIDPSNYPVLFHCTHGKDRTGIISCILGLIAGISDEVSHAS